MMMDVVAVVPPTMIETGFDGAGDGYEWAAMVDATPGWRCVASWGRDGWDIGDWPLVVVATVDEPDGRGFGMVERTEGDLATMWYPTPTARIDAIDAYAKAWWSANPERFGYDVVVALRSTPDDAPLPVRFRGPFSWHRYHMFDETGIDPHRSTVSPTP